jgi:general secretion pathway protein A
MYAPFFRLKRLPFSIAPDPRSLFMSERHREALAHLLYGVGGGGGFVLLTGEIGAGKTTVCRCFLEQIPPRCNVAYIFNPKLTVIELLQSVCEEFRIPVPEAGSGSATVKHFVDPLNEFLLRTHAVGQNNILIIDEAQNLSADVLEQLRLLTNLETNERKLLQIVLIGQPELRAMLARPELEQLAQRVIARYHLEAMAEGETEQYIAHRLAVAGLRGAPPFDRLAMERIHRWTRGVPRRINLLCDRALLGAYAAGSVSVDRDIVDRAGREVFDSSGPAHSPGMRYGRAVAVGLAAVVVGVGAVLLALFGGWQRAPGAGDDDRNANAPAQAAPGGSDMAARIGAAPAAPPSDPAAAQDAERSPAAAPAGPSPPAPGAASPAPAGGSSVADGGAAPVQGSAANGAEATELRASFDAPTRSEQAALRELAQVWKLDLADGDACAVAQRVQVQCYRSSAGLALLRQLDRPSILTLRDQGEQPVYALLTSLSDSSATLRMGEVSQTVTLSSLARVWRGDFATFWRTPPGYNQVLAEGHAGAAVERLAAQLAGLRGQASAPAQRNFDAALKARVVEFQVARGLGADGIAGPTTFMALNRATGVDEPRLQGER